MAGRATPERDRGALRARYREERDKRIRPEGADQYVVPAGRSAHWRDDPYTARVERPPIIDHVTLVMVGGGFAGLSVGARLREAGVDDFRIIEGGGDFGGVWYWNRYPGAMCDTAAMIYLPLLEETGYAPTMKYAFGPEIREHARRIGRHYRLYDNAVLSTTVTGLTWDDGAGHWIVTTDREDRITAKYVATGVGPLDRPKLPGIPGLETFTGRAFHTSRWDYGFTGGTPEGEPMANLADKRVGIIGTGASGVQCVPRLGADAGELFVFQRTPSTIDERNNAPIDPAWFQTLARGWQREWLINFATVQTGGFADVDHVDDGHTDLGRRIRDRLVEMNGGQVPEEFDAEVFARAYQDVDDAKTEEIRRRVDAVVTDPDAAEKLKAWYGLLCKRPGFHDEYLQTFNRPNVHLVDTDGKGVEQIDETGVWAGGVHHELDCLVYASGFEFGRDYTGSGAFPVVGRGGLTLAEKWADGMESFQGMFTHGFPNLFIIGFRQGMGFPINVTSNYTEAGRTLAAVVRRAEQVGAREVETSAEAEREWVAAIESVPAGVIGGADCTPGFYNNEGKPDSRAHRLAMTPHPMGPVGFLSYIEEWRTSGRFDGVEIRRGRAVASPEARKTWDFLRELQGAPAPASLVELREAGDRFGELTAAPTGVDHRPVDVAGIPGEWIEPTGAAAGTMLYLHGGGYVMGSVRSHRRLIGHLAKAAGVRALAIDYRLAPENPHPAQVEDALAAYRWLLEAGHDPAGLAIAGDSAGGGLAMLTLLRLRAEEDPLPAAAFLLSPWVDLAGTGDSMTSRAVTDLLVTAQGCKHSAAGFLPGGEFDDPAVSPLHADLTGLPPVYLQAGDHEVLLDDSTRLHARLRAAGVVSRLDVFPEMQHVFQMAAGTTPEANDAVARIGTWLGARLAT